MKHNMKRNLLIGLLVAIALCWHFRENINYVFREQIYVTNFVVYAKIWEKYGMSRPEATEMAFGIPSAIFGVDVGLLKMIKENYPWRYRELRPEMRQAIEAILELDRQKNLAKPQIKEAGA
jgi:hypothetical protein